MNTSDGPSASHAAHRSSVVTTRVLQPIERAQARVERERTEVTAEQHAFKQFADRVAAIEIAAPVSPTAGNRALLATDEVPEPMVQIRDAYRETIMAVDHYDREYGESLQTHFGAEMGADAATAVCEGAAHLFTPQFREALVTAARQSHQERADFLDTLDEEATSLAETRETLRHLITQLEQHTHRGSMTVHAQHGEAITERLETLVDDRQHLLHTRSQLSLLTGRDVCAYLYQAEAWTYPVLWAAAILRDLIEARSNTHNS